MSEYTKEMFDTDMKLATDFAKELQDTIIKRINQGAKLAKQKDVFSPQVMFMVSALMIAQLIKNGTDNGVSHTELSDRLRGLIDYGYELYAANNSAVNDNNAV